MIKLTKEEKELLNSVERGEWKSLANVKGKIKNYREVAKNTIRKDQRINIRISKNDLEGIQAKAIEEGMPYQTLIASIIHKYLTGKIVEG